MLGYIVVKVDHANYMLRFLTAGMVQLSSKATWDSRESSDHFPHAVNVHTDLIY